MRSEYIVRLGPDCCEKKCYREAAWPFHKKDVLQRLFGKG